MKVQFFSMTSANNVINKTKRLIVEKECSVFEDCDVLNPDLLVNYSDELLESNYCFIPKFRRYYFLKKPIITEGSKLVFPSHVDVLESWWNRGMKEMTCNIVRNSNQFNLYMNDHLFQCTQRTHKQVALAEIPAGGFPFLTSPSPSGHCFVLNAI